MESEEETQRPFKALRETVLLLAFAILLALVVKTFFVQSFYIPSESMEPGLIVNDRILVQKPSYWGSGGPQRGDVIVFDDPGGWLNGLESAQPMSLLARGLAKVGLYPTGGHLVKRVVGVAGDTIVCCDDEGRLSINGEPIDEDDFIEPQPDPPKSCDGAHEVQLQLDRRPGALGHRVRDGRQPRRLGRLHGPSVPGDLTQLRPRGRLRPDRGCRRQGVRPGLADRPGAHRAPPGRLRRRPGRRAERPSEPTPSRCLSARRRRC